MQVTGGAGTLALEAARALLEHGISGLALLDVNPQQGDEATTALRAAYPGVNIIQGKVDVTDSSSVDAAFNEAAHKLGSIDCFCNFAGIVGCTHAIEMGELEWRRTLDVNSTGTFLCAQAAAKHMKQQGRGGSIVLIASISAHRVNYPQPQVAYNVSKSAVLAMARSLAAEWAHLGIRVNTLSPGYMDTILNEGEGIADARKVWADRNPMGRMGSPPELTGPLILLCSQFGGAYITGSDIVVDGMRSAYLEYLRLTLLRLTSPFGRRCDCILTNP